MARESRVTVRNIKTAHGFVSISYFDRYDPKRGHYQEASRTNVGIFKVHGGTQIVTYPDENPLEKSMNKMGFFKDKDGNYKLYTKR